jgi:hypothetical protein
MVWSLENPIYTRMIWIDLGVTPFFRILQMILNDKSLQGSTIHMSAESIAQNASAASCFHDLGEAVALSILGLSRKFNAVSKT